MGSCPDTDIDPTDLWKKNITLHVTEDHMKFNGNECTTVHSYLLSS